MKDVCPHTLEKAMPSAEKAGEGEIIGRDSIDGSEQKLTKLKGENLNGCVLNQGKGK